MIYLYCLSWIAVLIQSIIITLALGKKFNKNIKSIFLCLTNSDSLLFRCWFVLLMRVGRRIRFLCQKSHQLFNYCKLLFYSLIFLISLLISLSNYRLTLFWRLVCSFLKICRIHLSLCVSCPTCSITMQ